MKKLTVIGIGGGKAGGMTTAAFEAREAAEVIVG